MAERYVRDEWILNTLEGLLGPEALAELKGMNPPPESYWRQAVQQRLVTDENVIAALATRFRMKIADVMLSSLQAREAVSEHLARKHHILPLAITDSVLDIATADPNDLDCERSLAFATGRTVRMSLAAPARILERIEELYRPDNAVEKILDAVSDRHQIESISDTIEDSDLDISADRASERPIIRLVDHVLAEGIASRASDIHIEPEESGIVIRYRIDGVLAQAMALPRATGIPLVSRVKIMSGLDIADRMRPQDGRARVAVNGNRVDLRVSTLPASQGEKVVIRILDSRQTLLSVDALGLNPDEMERMTLLLNLREGIVLVTGPTGSGKTTTLYSGLRHVQARGVNIVTVEDPVEYRLNGIVQVQVNEKAGLTFASALRSILRQDPDVILVGEIRDKETAQIAVQASLTGHLVFSTLHTIDAASSVTRLMDIGIESYKMGAALKGIVAQRLLRKLCVKCRVENRDLASPRMQRWFPTGVPLYKAVGCPECSQTGYRGRMAITEVLIANIEVERRITASESVERINEAARAGGMRSLWDSGVQKVRAGDTSMEELIRVVEMPVEFPKRASPSGADSVSKRTPPSATRTISTVQRTTPQHGTIPVLPEDVFQLVDDEAGAAGKRGKARVLLVEDEEPLRRVLRELLEREGYTVVEAADGVQALDEIDRSGPDIIVLDLNLPRLDGYGVLTHLRSRPNTAMLPVIVLTAKGDEDSEVRVFEFGADDYLSKPFRPRALSARLRSLLKRS